MRAAHVAFLAAVHHDASTIVKVVLDLQPDASPDVLLFATEQLLSHVERIKDEATLGTDWRARRICTQLQRLAELVVGTAIDGRTARLRASVDAIERLVREAGGGA